MIHKIILFRDWIHYVAALGWGKSWSPIFDNYVFVEMKGSALVKKSELFILIMSTVRKYSKVADILK